MAIDDSRSGQGAYEVRDGDTCGACGATMGSVAVHAAWHLELARLTRCCHCSPG